MNLQGKKAVVTGGNSGIGYATAQKLKEYGAEVLITGRNEEKVNTAAKELGVESLVADVLDLQALEAGAKAANDKLGGIDILFVNAGVFMASPVGETTEEMYDTQFGINFKGAVFTIEKFLPFMSEGGSIINLSSINAYMGMATTAIYSATKAAFNSYTRAAATELAARGIRINAVNPGPVATPIFGKTGMPQEQLEGFAQALTNRVPLKRLGQPEEIAELVAFLASDKASFITGSEYNIDGGMNINPGII